MTGKLIGVEFKLQLRDWGTITFGLLFPAVLLLILGFAFPGFRDPNPDLNGGRLVDLYTPIILVLGLVLVGISGVASVLTTYRQDGVLRRLRTTPVGPSRLLTAQLIAQLMVATIGVTLAVVAALALLGVPAPDNWFAMVASALLAAMALFAIGLLVGAIAPSTSAANAITTIVWIPLMLFAGLWFPREVMPDLMRRISDVTPGGAAVEALQLSWFGPSVPASSLAVLAGFTLLAGLVSARIFRWE